MKKILAYSLLTLLVLLLLWRAAPAQPLNALTRVMYDRLSSIANVSFAAPGRWTSVGIATSQVAADNGDYIAVYPRHLLGGSSQSNDVPSTWTSLERTATMPILLDTTGPGLITNMSFFAFSANEPSDGFGLLNHMRVQVFHGAEADAEATTAESGRPCVDVPLGYFMGASGKWGAIYTYQDSPAGSAFDWGSWRNARDGTFIAGRTMMETYHNQFFAQSSGGMSNYFVQPFPGRVLVRIKNDMENDTYPVSLYYQIEYVKGATGLPYIFHAKYRQEFPATSGSDYVATPTITGTGQLIGIIGTLMSPTTAVFEGDVFVRLDGQTDTTASLRYSGNEEFWKGGFYWDRGVDAGPFSATLLRELAYPSGTNRNEFFGGYRFFQTPIPFASSAQINFNHGDVPTLNTEIANFAGVTFWYQAEPCAAVAVPKWRPSTSATNLASGRQPPGKTMPTNAELPVNSYAISPEAGFYNHPAHIKLDGNGDTGITTEFDCDEYSPTDCTAYNGSIIEHRFTDGAGGNDYVFYIPWIPADAGLTSGNNKLTVYYGKSPNGGIFNVYVSTDLSGCGNLTGPLALSSGSQDTYSATAGNVGKEIGSATYNAANLVTGRLNCIQLRLNGKNAASGSYYLYPDLFVVKN